MIYKISNYNDNDCKLLQQKYSSIGITNDHADNSHNQTAGHIPLVKFIFINSFWTFCQHSLYNHLV